MLKTAGGPTLNAKVLIIVAIWVPSVRIISPSPLPSTASTPAPPAAPPPASTFAPTSTPSSSAPLAPAATPTPSSPTSAPAPTPASASTLVTSPPALFIILGAVVTTFSLLFLLFLLGLWFIQLAQKVFHLIEAIVQ